MSDKNNINTTDDESTPVYNFIPDELREKLKSLDLDDEDSEDDVEAFKITPDEARTRLKDFDFGK